MRHIYKIDDGETHWYSAHTEENALYMHAVEYGDCQTIEEYIEDYGYPDIDIVNDDNMLKVIQDGDINDFVEQSAKKWAEEKKGFIASTVW